MYRTRHRYLLLYFNVILDASCKFSTRRNDIYDPFARIIKNPLKSTIFWTRHLNSATRRLNSATRQILHWNIVAYFGEASSQLGDASAQLRDASKMQLWPQWLTIIHLSHLIFSPDHIQFIILVSALHFGAQTQVCMYTTEPFSDIRDKWHYGVPEECLYDSGPIGPSV